MEERHVDFKKAYELIIGNKVFTDKKNINWEALVNLKNIISFLFKLWQQYLNKSF